jgi:hypothetical protein
MCEYWEPVRSSPLLLASANSDPRFPFPKDFQKSLLTDAIQGVDVYHQLSRLRHGKNLPDAEVELMMRTFAENLQSYDQVVEVGIPRKTPLAPSSLTVNLFARCSRWCHHTRVVSFRSA